MQLLNKNYDDKHSDDLNILRFRKVAFAPYNASTPNLVNGAGLPAGPFRMKVNLQSK